MAKTGMRGRKVPARGAVSQRRPRRWPRRVAAVAIVVVTLVLGVWGWAWLSTDTSTMARAMWWMEADIDDQYRFPARTIPAGDDPSPLPEGPEVDVLEPPTDATARDFDGFLRRTGTRAFLILHDDRLVYERYFDGADRQSRHTSFSVAKSFLSTLVGIAIDEGLIGGVTDPVTEYVPELAERDLRGIERDAEEADERRRHHDKARIMRIERLQTLAVERTAPGSSAAGQPDRHRAGNLGAPVKRGGLVDDLV